jgi:hypothetical protein
VREKRMHEEGLRIHVRREKGRRRATDNARVDAEKRKCCNEDTLRLRTRESGGEAAVEDPLMIALIFPLHDDADSCDDTQSFKNANIAKLIEQRAGMSQLNIVSAIRLRMINSPLITVFPVGSWFCPCQRRCRLVDSSHGHINS